MTQLDLGLNLSTKRTRKREFLDEMRRVVPWLKLIALVEPHCAKGKTGRPPFPVAKMLQMHFMQQIIWTPPVCQGPTSTLSKHDQGLRFYIRPVVEAYACWP